MSYYIFYKYPDLLITFSNEKIEYITNKYYTMNDKIIFTNIEILCDYIKTFFNNYTKYSIYNIINVNDINIIYKLINENKLINYIFLDNIPSTLNDNFINLFDNINNINKLIIYIRDAITIDIIIFIEKLFNNLHGNIVLNSLIIVPNIHFIHNQEKFKLLCKELIKKTNITKFKLETFYNKYGIRVRNIPSIDDEYIEYINNLSNLSLTNREVPLKSDTKSAAKNCSITKI